MSYFDEMELNGGVDPYTAREQQEEQAEAEHFSKCGCGDERCSIDDRDATNVKVGERWFNADCCAICWNCQAVDDLKLMLKVSNGRFVHRQCPDTFNEVRR